MRIALGSMLLLLPFVALAIFMVRIDGWRMAAVVWGVTIAVVAVIVAGAFLVAP